MVIDETRSTRPQIIRSVLLWLLLFSLFLAPWFYGLTDFSHQLLSELIVFSFFLASAIFLPRLEPHRLIVKGLDRWVLLTLGAGVLYVLLSAVPYYSFLGLTRLFSVVALYAIIRRLVADFSVVNLFLWTFLTTGAFYAAYGLLQYYGVFPHDYWYDQSHLASRYVNGGHFAAFLLFPLFIGLSFCLSNRNVVIKGLTLVLLGIILWAFALTQARTAWLSFLTGAGFFLYLFRKEGWLTHKVFLGLMGFGVFYFFLFLQIGGWDVVTSRWDQLWNPDKLGVYSMNYRLAVWEGSLRAIARRPWGWGLGAFVHIFPQFAVQEDRFLVDYAHNEFLHLGVDMGVLGIFLALALLITFFQGGFRYLANPSLDRSQKLTGMVLISTLLGLALNSQLDFPLRIHATSLYFAVFLALAAFLFNPSLPGGWVFNRSVFQIPSILLTLIFLWPVSKQLFAQVHYAQGIKYEKAFDWNQAGLEFEKAIEWAPRYHESYEATGRIYQKKAVLAFGKDKKRWFRQAAIDAFEKAAKHQPYWPASYFVLGTLYEAQGGADRASENYAKALERDPLNGSFLFHYSYFCLRHGQIEKAVSLMSQFHRIAFKDYGNIEKDPCRVVDEFSRYTQRYDHLKQVVGNRWEDRLCLGYALGKINQWDKAALEFNVALKKMWGEYGLEASLEEVGKKVEEFYRNYSRSEDALAFYQGILERIPANSFAKDRMLTISREMELSREGI